MDITKSVSAVRPLYTVFFCLLGLAVVLGLLFSPAVQATERYYGSTIIVQGHRYADQPNGGTSWVSGRLGATLPIMEAMRGGAPRSYGEPVVVSAERRVPSDLNFIMSILQRLKIAGEPSGESILERSVRSLPPGNASLCGIWSGANEDTCKGFMGHQLAVKQDSCNALMQQSRGRWTYAVNFGGRSAGLTAGFSPFNRLDSCFADVERYRMTMNAECAGVAALSVRACLISAS